LLELRNACVIAVPTLANERTNVIADYLQRIIENKSPTNPINVES